MANFYIPYVTGKPCHKLDTQDRTFQKVNLVIGGIIQDLKGDMKNPAVNVL